MKDKILEVLKTVIYPGFKKDIVSYGFVKEVTQDGKINIEIAASKSEIKEELEKDILKKLKTENLG